jgi:hypothetical protein
MVRFGGRYISHRPSFTASVFDILTLSDLSTFIDQRHVRRVGKAYSRDEPKIRQISALDRSACIHSLDLSLLSSAMRRVFIPARQ